ncbi:hypothetical protein [Cuspidothrix issatschenkoi]|jgi:hypothetical protein|uniref:Uncharacterized protein n=1 Tax=Cuspidothrix issatschenkoi CHARLIE-1 TaxID=2052836 RepID=A0A2S6CY84_9CYAN|nr:hypothetical protein [Cuspidothrix issatschenkoi]PPJ64725.1 hypothetical protein CUN59_03570 [Cuspidothrix issatschenkoi CHARLIE-1]
MKTLKLFTLIPVGFTISLLLTQASFGKPAIIKLNNPLQTDPITLTGTSGGEVKTDCGYISTTPSQVIDVTKSLPYLQLTAESEGKPTLLVDGPGGRFCVLSNDSSERKPKLSGYWTVGQYSVYVGELSKGKHNYTLSISQQQK